MAISNVKATLQVDIERVWEIVTSLYDYSWRSDLSKIEILEDSEELQNDIKSVSEMFKDVFTDKELSKSLIWAFVLWAIFY